MAQTIKLKRGTTTPTTSNIVSGEVAIDTSARKLYINDGGTIKEVGGGGGGITYSVKTSAYTASAGDGIIADSSGGAFTITLPATPSAGDIVSIVDGAAWATNNVTVARNGSTIEGAAENLTLDVSGIALDLIYDGSTWQLYPLSGTTAAATESDTLATVTARGASTTSNITVGDTIAVGGGSGAANVNLNSASSQAATVAWRQNNVTRYTMQMFSGGTGWYWGAYDSAGANFKNAGSYTYGTAATNDSNFSFRAGTFTFKNYDDTSNHLYINSSGGVGIGTTSTSGLVKLTIGDTTDTSTTNNSITLQSAVSATDTYRKGLTCRVKEGITTGDIADISFKTGVSDASEGNIVFRTGVLGTTAPTDRMRITADAVRFLTAVEEKQYSLTGTAIDPANGTIQYKTLSANTTLTESLSDGEYVTLMIDDGAGYTITWPTINWIGGSAPTLATTGWNIIELWQVGSGVYGAFAGST